MVFAVLFGLIYGFGIALLICAPILNRSNNLGDSKGGVDDFSKSGMRTYRTQDRVPSNTLLDDICNPVILKNNAERNWGVEPDYSEMYNKNQSMEDEINNMDLSNTSWHT